MGGNQNKEKYTREILKKVLSLDPDFNPGFGPLRVEAGTGGTVGLPDFYIPANSGKSRNENEMIGFECKYFCYGEKFHLKPEQYPFHERSNRSGFRTFICAIVETPKKKKVFMVWSGHKISELHGQEFRHPNHTIYKCLYSDLVENIEETYNRKEKIPLIETLRFLTLTNF